MLRRPPCWPHSLNSPLHEEAFAQLPRRRVDRIEEEPRCCLPAPSPSSGLRTSSSSRRPCRPRSVCTIRGSSSRGPRWRRSASLLRAYGVSSGTTAPSSPPARGHQCALLLTRFQDPPASLGG